MKFGAKTFLIVQDVKTAEGGYHLIDQARLTETAVRYLKSFIADYEDAELVSDILGKSAIEIEDDAEIEKLRALVDDLKQDRIELIADVEKLR